MRILLATLATPTYTSELYEFTIADMAELYATKAFVETPNTDAEANALAWAEEAIEEEYHEYLDSDEPRYTIRADRTEQREDGPRRFVFWSQTDEIACEGSFCLLLRWQEIGA